MEHPARAGDRVGAAHASRWPIGATRGVDLGVAPRVPSAAAVVAEVELPRRSGVADQDAWEALHPVDPGHTFTPRNPLVRAGEMPLESGRRIDYVMVRSGVHGPTLHVPAARWSASER